MEMKKVKIAYQGISGAYSQQAIMEFGLLKGIDFVPIPKKNFKDLFEDIDGGVFLGFVPIENSTTGSITQCYDLFMNYGLEIIGEYKFKVRHCLMVNDGVGFKDIERVYSHPEALSQCSDFIQKNDFLAVPFYDTAGSVKDLKESGDVSSGAIAGEMAGEKYGLKILKRDFQNEINNTTRFLIVKKKGKSFDFQKRLGVPNKSSLNF